jgi:FixJ family two-component response regulator
VTGEPTLFIVAGDPAARHALAERAQRWRVAARVCHSADEFLRTHRRGESGCVLLNVSRPATDLELLRCLGPPGTHLPVVVLGDRPDVATVVRAMKLGAADFLDMPCDDERLDQAVEEALAWDAANRRQIARAEGIRRRMDRLDTGQRAVLDLLVHGRSNAQIADVLGMSVRAIEVRRAKVLKIMGARSPADLARRVIGSRATSLEADGS